MNAGDYKLIPGRTQRDDPGRVLAYEPLGNHGGKGGHVLFVSGAVKWCVPKEYVNLKTN